ncbi:cat eye syndrome critical region protein 1 [Delitschia confertaspora ATCC 74209]|uniref:adenosine deaminase n=1 Tax=Delitschia confertaspora ATCC 74209 TaxID=1513339 RepID=A0A9P4JG21_9PLEO|nr:cat eye syndrome critical region protein 1 [Delitschia confertaspora ATCC 74209]
MPQDETLEQQAKRNFEEALQTAVYHENYATQREELLSREKENAWDFKATEEASQTEKAAGKILYKIREYERDFTFGNKASEDLPDPETLDMGGQFLTNKGRVELESRLFKIAQRTPKGAIQHLHFNAELPPDRLLEEARSMPNMFIQSKRALLTLEDLRAAELIFNVLPQNTVSVNIFSEEYVPRESNKVGEPMKWEEFRDTFARKFGHLYPESEEDKHQPTGSLRESSAQAHVKLFAAERWIKQKMILSEEEAYGISQTVNGVWARFNQATRCFKGLLNYEKVFRWYISNAIDNMIEEGIMYAELRPMLLDKAIPADDGINKLTHADQMNLILQCVKEKQAELQKDNMTTKFPFGVKIIYCTPRSIPKAKMRSEMQDCINLKIRFPDLICGFDLVGAEDRANHIGFYYDELVSFQKTCEALNLDIPFLFHAGETLLDTGGSKDPKNSNLYDAALLNCKRIGHGFSLMKHPELIKKFKEKDICIELCPISNELLHLCRNIKEHPFPQLLAAGIPCSLNSDNPSLFSNSMSHEFYQVMVGSPAMTIHGWKQLALWSLKYSCLSKQEKTRAESIFMKEWEGFCAEVVTIYQDFADKLDDSGQPLEEYKAQLARKPQS